MVTGKGRHVAVEAPRPRPCVLFVGGGTGGHLYPALAVARAAREAVPGLRAVFVGTRRGLEADVVPKEGFELVTLDVVGLPRRLNARAALAAWKAALAGLSAMLLVARLRPDAVVATGGYVSGPVALAARVMRRRILLHEQNAIPGLANRLLARFADVIAVANEACVEPFRLAGARGRIVVTGNPVRPEITAANRDAAARELGLDPRRKTLLVTGASQGSRVINHALVPDGGLRSICARIPGIQVIYQTGKAHWNEVVRGLEAQGIRVRIEGRGGGDIIVVPYLYNISSALAAADLAIGRAGALTVSEFTARGLPSILIPLASSAEGHQEANARALERTGGCVVIPERELSGRALADTVVSLFRDQGRLARMSGSSKGYGRPDATERILSELKALLTTPGPA